VTELRASLLAALASVIASLRLGSPTLVAVEGRSAAGKTHFADELARAVTARGRPTLRSSIDDFHRPGHKQRSIARAYTPESYYAEGYDYAQLRSQLIEPLRSGDRRCRLAHWDSARDLPAAAGWLEAPADAVAIVDGAFLFHRTLWDAWDYAIWLEIDWDTMLARASERDVAWVGSDEAVVRKYRELWIPTHRRYEALIGPRARCDVVVDNRAWDAPVLVEIRA
jgi:uridine kinase